MKPYQTMLASGLAIAAASGAVHRPAVAQQAYSPYVAEDYPRQVLWGDTHLHTNLSSLDASDSGRFTLGMEDAYRLARGEVVEDNYGSPVRLSRPLDFLVVADHSEFLGLWEAVKSGNEALLATDWGRKWREEYLEAESYEDYAALDTEMLTPGTPLDRRSAPVLDDVPFRKNIWSGIGELADVYNEPGRFTAMIGFEWSSTPGWSNLHRVVMFRDDSNKTSQVLPLTATETVDPEDLWEYLENYEALTGGQVLAAPHNSNLSNGLMFTDAKMDRSPIDIAYAEQRARWEPVVEVTQMKGDSETHPVLSPTDEFAEYETWYSFAGKMPPSKMDEKAINRLRSSYIRAGLRSGLEIQNEVGANPFKFGLIGGTDAHNALPDAEENNFWGKFYTNAPSADRMTDPGLSSYKMQSPWKTAELAASGYTGVWASANTREAIFDALKRREVYATTGPRIELRFFGGWDFYRSDVMRSDFAKAGYEGGVPMGGDLTRGPDGEAPTFMIRAVKDPLGANLDRVQVVKGWVDADGSSQEAVFDVALSDKRTVQADGSVDPVGSTVDLTSASYENSIGSNELATVWKDPQFDPHQLAFYYVRVLEIPTPRWTAYDAARFGLKDVPEDIPMITQERAYSSPIWYTPSESDQ
nr:DUF3604 domain-containing protein [Henriciella litoralis]